MSIYFYRNKTLTVEKQFFNKKKTITYTGDIWMRAEKFFKTIQQARQSGTNVKIHIFGEMFICSDRWGEYQKRYTGIHAFNIMGGVKPLTGVNLDDDEWNMLTANFESIKDFLGGNRNALQNVFIPPKEIDDHVKVYTADWFLNGKLVDEKKVSTQEFYSFEEAEMDAMCRKPVRGVDYDGKDGEPKIKIKFDLRMPPEDTDLMNLVLVESLSKSIEAESKAHCEACKVNSDSQFDHFKSGNCLDDTYDHLDYHCEPAKKKIKVNDLMSVFDAVRTEIGVKPILSKQLAKGALAWIPNDQVLEQIQDVEINSNPLMGVVKKVHAKVVNQ